MAAVLEVSDLTKHFVGLVAVDSVGFRVAEAEIVGIIGPNGSGKTTLINMIAGTLTPTKGRVVFRANDITGWASVRVARAGIGRTFQQLSVFENMTVFQSVLLSLQLREPMPWWRFLLAPLASEQKQIKQADEILDFLRISSFKNERAGSVPAGIQRRLEVGVALARGGELLLLDEPLSGMTLGEMNELVAIFRSLRDAGKTLLIIEHNVRALVNLCDRMVAMTYGKKIAEGTPRQVVSNTAVIESYLGRLSFGQLSERN